MTARTDILLVSDLTSGGAGIACARLKEALDREGRLQCRWVAGQGNSRMPDALAADRPGLLEILVRRGLARCRGAARGRLGRLRRRAGRWCNERDLLRCVKSFQPRLVHLHNLHEHVTFRFLELLPRRLPVFWTLHDAWPLTGYCFYAGDCADFLQGCRGACAGAGAWGDAWRPPAAEWQRRDRFFRQNASRLTFLSPSRWLAQKARARLGDRVRVEHLPNSVSTDLFRPVRPRGAVRRALGLAEDRPVLLAGAQRVDDRRKGIALLRDACGILKGQGIRFEVVLFGGAERSGRLPAEWRFAGSIEDERLLNLYYNAADAFVLPSLEDNLPNTLLESLAAGTPCIAFDVGGCAEAVRRGETGFLARAGDSKDLAAAVRALLSLPDEEKRRMDERCRATAEREYALQAQARSYLEIVAQRVGLAVEQCPS